MLPSDNRISAPWQAYETFCMKLQILQKLQILIGRVQKSTPSHCILKGHHVVHMNKFWHLQPCDTFFHYKLHQQCPEKHPFTFYAFGLYWYTCKYKLHKPLLYKLAMNMQHVFLIKFLTSFVVQIKVIHPHSYFHLSI